MTDMPPGAADLVRRISAGQTSPSAAVEESLARIAARNAELNAFSVVLDNEAREQARLLELGRDGTHGPLFGVPVAIKEELDVAGCITTFGGHGNSTPVAADGEVVRRLREAGAVIVGKTLMSEFGASPYTESVAYGYT